MNDIFNKYKLCAMGERAFEPLNALQKIIKQQSFLKVILRGTRKAIGLGGLKAVKIKTKTLLKRILKGFLIVLSVFIAALMLIPRTIGFLFPEKAPIAYHFSLVLDYLAILQC
ncbi:MAG: hypothetical protein U5K79_08415 [Cyclobacteriaceae bacterium]|nr:hypothetical protein [Cyclobacteriaceae bacterium]